MAVSVLVFFGAIAVIGWFALTASGDDSGQEPVFSEQTEAGTDAEGDAGEDFDAPEDEYVVGEFGDPVDELYQDDSGGGWGPTPSE